MSDCGCEIEVESAGQARVLWQLLAINLTMFVAELVAGLIADSAALLADSLDMLADAGVYAVSLYAVSRSARMRAWAAMSSGYLQVGLGGLALLEVARRLVTGPSPDPLYMIAVSVVSLMANVLCLRLVSRHRDGGVHMRASFIFSQNDVIANSAVILGGLLVAMTSWYQWDLVVGAGIGFLVLSGGWRILRDARRALAEPASGSPNGNE